MSKELRMKDEKKCKLGNFKGITLISLVITIVVLIILASVAIYLSLSNNGIFNRANEAKELTNKQTATEKINLKITTAQMNKYAEKQEMPTLKELSEVLRDDNEIQYVTEKSQIASTKYEVGENPNSIYTKLNEYPYEFEINGQLQLASIDGVKIANTGDKVTIDKEQYEELMKLNNILYPNKLISIDAFTDTTNEQTYTVPHNGWLYIFANRIGTSFTISFYRNDMAVFQFNGAGNNTAGNTTYIPVKQGDIIKKTQNNTGFNMQLNLYYFE